MKVKESLRICRSAVHSMRTLSEEANQIRTMEDAQLRDDMLLEHEKRFKKERLNYLEAFKECIKQMEGMPERGRQVLWKFYLFGFSNKEIAASLKYSLRSVCRMKQDGLKWLAEKEKFNNE